MSRPILYTAELDYPEEALAGFLEWYAFRHAPDLYACGFRSCACYRAVEGGMDIVDVYEAPSASVFTTPRYRSLADRDRYVAAILSKRRAKAHTVYEHEMLAPAPAGEMAPLDADWLSLLRFAAVPEADDRVGAWLAREEAPRLAALGAKRLRLAFRGIDHPAYTTHRPRGLVLVEWPHRPPPEAELRQRLAAAFAVTVSALDAFIGYRLYPWPDKSGAP